MRIAKSWSADSNYLEINPSDSLIALFQSIHYNNTGIDNLIEKLKTTLEWILKKFRCL